MNFARFLTHSYHADEASGSSAIGAPKACRRLIRGRKVYRDKTQRLRQVASKRVTVKLKNSRNRGKRKTEKNKKVLSARSLRPRLYSRHSRSKNACSHLKVLLFVDRRPQRFFRFSVPSFTRRAKIFS